MILNIDDVAFHLCDSRLTLVVSEDSVSVCVVVSGSCYCPILWSVYEFVHHSVFLIKVYHCYHDGEVFISFVG